MILRIRSPLSAAPAFPRSAKSQPYPVTNARPAVQGRRPDQTQIVRDQLEEDGLSVRRSGANERRRATGAHVHDRCVYILRSFILSTCRCHPNVPSQVKARRFASGTPTSTAIPHAMHIGTCGWTSHTALPTLSARAISEANSLSLDAPLGVFLAIHHRGLAGQAALRSARPQASRLLSAVGTISTRTSGHIHYSNNIAVRCL